MAQLIVGCPSFVALNRKGKPMKGMPIIGEYEGKFILLRERPIPWVYVIDRDTMQDLPIKEKARIFRLWKEKHDREEQEGEGQCS